MRIQAIFEIVPGSRLCINYQHFLTGMVYGLLSKSAPGFTKRLHDLGFWRHQEKPFKLFCFSPLRGGPGTTHVESGNLVFETDRLSWEFDSPVPAVTTLMAESLSSCSSLRVWQVELRVIQVKSLPLPDFSGGRARFVCLSPLVASVYDPQLRHRYLEPTEERFWEVISENLSRKWEAYHGTLPPSAIRLIPDRDYLAVKKTSKLISFRSDCVRGYLVPFAAEAHPDLLAFGHQCGFGSRNSQGFGMVRAVSER